MQPPDLAPPPPIPPINLDRVFHIRKTLKSEFGTKCTGVELVGEAMDQFVACIRKTIPAHADVIRQSVGDWSGRVLSQDAYPALAARLAGAATLMLAGRPVPPWAGQTVVEWCAMQILAATDYKRRATPKYPEAAGFLVRTRVLTGTPTGRLVTRFWSYQEARSHARSLGFGRDRSPTAYRDGRELFGLRFVGLFTPELSRPEDPSYRLVGCPANLKNYNRALIKIRRRIQFDCPGGYTHECYQCPRGLAFCVAATHAADFVPIDCPRCGARQWQDPDPEFGSGEVCIQCRGLVHLAFRGSIQKGS